MIYDDYSFAKAQDKLISLGESIFWNVDYNDKFQDKAYFVRKSIKECEFRDKFFVLLGRQDVDVAHSVKIMGINEIKEKDIIYPIYLSFLKATMSKPFINIAVAFNLACINIDTNKAKESGTDIIDITRYISKSYKNQDEIVSQENLQREIIKYFDIVKIDENQNIMLKYKKVS